VVDRIEQPASDCWCNRGPTESEPQRSIRLCTSFGDGTVNPTAEGSSTGAQITVAKVAVSADYFRVMGIDRVRGRVFTDADAAGGPPVVGVTESVAARFWPGEDGVGRHIKLGFGKPEEQPWASVIGIVRDVKQTALSDAAMPSICMPIPQTPRPFLLSQMTYVVRPAPNAPAPEPAFREALRSIDPNLPVTRLAPIDALIAFSVSTPRFRTMLFSAFAATALLLVATGVFGVLSYSRDATDPGDRSAHGPRRRPWRRRTAGDPRDARVHGGRNRDRPRRSSRPRV
jgi:hypothetical protein